MPADKLLGADSSIYANVFSFLGLPLSRDLTPDVDAVVMGVPYDLATSGRAGARSGPTAIRQASAQLRWEDKRWPWRFSLASALNVIDYGDLNFDEGDSHTMVQSVVKNAASIMSEGKSLLSLGGDHYISLPLLRAVAEQHGKVALVHFDAHTDTNDSDPGFKHGSMFYQAMCEGLYDPAHSIQLGIRTEYNYDTHPLKVLDAPWVNSHSADEAISEILQRTGNLPVYISVDIDCLDPAYAPGTGTPVAGGISSDKLLQILRGLAALNIVAADVMEVAPAYDSSEITALAAATVALELLYVLADKKRAREHGV